MLDERRRHIDHVTMTPLEHVFDRPCSDLEEAGEIDGDRGVEVLVRVLREGLADVDPSVVDETVDPAKGLDRLSHDASRRLGIGDVTLDRHDPGILRPSDRS